MSLVDDLGVPGGVEKVCLPPKTVFRLEHLRVVPEVGQQGRASRFLDPRHDKRRNVLRCDDGCSRDAVVPGGLVRAGVGRAVVVVSFVVVGWLVVDVAFFVRVVPFVPVCLGDLLLCRAKDRRGLVVLGTILRSVFQKGRKHEIRPGRVQTTKQQHEGELSQRDSFAVAVLAAAVTAVTAGAPRLGGGGAVDLYYHHGDG
mmetsp:Transcript_4347/g.9486  ORF Transcript_4347/g.9486 Transcript_4347/m.9486 type:complete len:200 (+) Transcript_4347:187-786(+)